MRHNFWINENRQETVHNLSKNDNYSQAVLTDCYKQVQNGGHPSQINSYIPSQNNDARSHPSDQQRSPGSQYMLPYSVCSVPLKSSYVSSFHPQQAFSMQSNDSHYSSQYSQAHQNLHDSSGLMNFKNPNTSVSQVYNSSGIPVLTRDNQNTHTQVPRIRVRDVFSLNKSTISSEVPNNNSYQIHQKEQLEYGLNFASNAICNNENQSQFVSYVGNNLQQSNRSVPYYHPTETQHFQNSSSFYHPNTGSQGFGTSQHLERNLNLNISEMNTNVKRSLLEKVLKQANTQDPNVQKKNSSPLAPKSRRVRIVPKRNSVQINSSNGNNSGYGCTLAVNNILPHESSNLCNFTQLQNERQIRDGTCSLRSNSTIQGSNDGPGGTTPASAKSPSYQQSNSQDGTVIKISIPHNGQNTYVTLSDCDLNNKNSSLNLPYLLEEDDHLVGGWGQNNPACKNTNENCVNTQAPEIGEANLQNHLTPSSVSNVINSSPNPAQNSHSSESSYQQNLNAPPRKRFCQVRESFLDVNKENLTQFLSSSLENNLENSSSRVGSSESIAGETVFQNEMTLRLKQEKLIASVESPVPNHDVSGGIPNKKVLLEIIKTEKTPVDVTPAEQEDNTQSSEEPNPLHQPLTSETEINENTEYARIEENVPPQIPEPDSEAVKDSENCIQQTANSKNDTNCQMHGSLTENRQTVVASEKNYKSKINRDKLDMLIQFLEKDEEPVQIVKKKSGDQKNRSSEVDLNHNRRKLNKTCIIKNKNNSREMVSMISNKNSRLELPKCSPPTPQIVKQNSDKAEERRVSSSDEKSNSEESRNSSEKESQAEGDEGFSALASKAVKKQFQETSVEGSYTERLIQKGENVLSKIRTIQSAETVFCENCDLVATLDSFWINLASGELKCLNCFKKVLLKCGKITSKSKTNYVSKSGVELSEKGGTGRETERSREIERNSESSLKEKNRTQGFSKLDHSDANSKNKEIVQHEIEKSPDSVASEKNYISGNPKKETMASPKSSRRPSISENKPPEKGRTSEEQKRARMEVPEEQPMKTITSDSWNHKIKHSEGISKPMRKYNVSLENCTHSKPLSISKQLTGALEKPERKDESANSKVKVSVENLKKDQVSDQLLKRNNAKDCVISRTENTLRKSLSRDEENADECTKKEKKDRRRSQSKEFVSRKFPEVCLKTDTKRLAEKSVKKSIEGHTINNDNSEPATKKSTKHEQSEKTKILGPSKESCHKLKDSNSSEELSAKDTTCISNSEKHKRAECVGQSRKRKNSDEDLGAVKVRIVEDVMKKEVKLGPQSMPASSKESITRYIIKPLENEMQNLRSSSDKFRRKGLSKGEGEHSKKDAKQVLYSSSTGKVKEEKKVETTFEKAKAQENTKQKASDKLDTSRRKSKEEMIVHKETKTEVKQGTEATERRKGNSKESSPRSHVEELSKTKRSSEHDRKEAEGREKNHSRKTPKADTSTEQLQVSDAASRPLKENQNTKTRSSTATEDGKLKHRNREEVRRERKKNMEGRKDLKMTRNKAKTKKDVETSWDKKGCSEGQCDKNQAENRKAKTLDKRVLFGRKVEDGPLTKIQSSKHSDSLFAKLMQKTKKLSWSLLSETQQPNLC